MSRRDPKVLRDGFSTILRGVNSGLAPVSLGRDQLAWAVNATFRNNFATHRPGWTKRPLAFLTDAESHHFRDGIFEGAIAFERRSQLVTIISGRLFSIALDSWSVLDVSPTLNSATPPAPDISPAFYRAWFAEAEDFIIAQDGQSAPWIYDGASARRSDTFGIDGAREVPVGTAMVFSGGRLVVAVANGQQFVVGDITGGASGTANYDFKDAVLKFTENDIMAQGGAFSVPINSGPITALRPVAQVDTSTGQGPTQVFTTGAIFSLNAPTDRTTWQTVNFPIGTVSMIQAGGLSDRATVNINGDIWTRSYDGVRSFIVARRDFQYTWINAPMSQEIVRAINNDDINLLGHASACVFDNRLFMTVQPYRSWNHGICHRGLAVIDFAPLAYLGERNNPAWEGIWTGLQILQVFTGTFAGIERGFIFALNATGQIELWEMTRSEAFDNTGTALVPIEWIPESGAFTFPRFPGAESVPAQELVSLDGGRLMVDELEGSVTFVAYYRMDQDPCWHLWHQWSACATQTTCRGTAGVLACSTPQPYQLQYRKPFFLPTPLEAKDTVTNRNLNWGREMQTRLVITGACRIKRLEADAHDCQEDVVGLPATDESCIGQACCPPSLWSYVIPPS